MLKRIQRLMPEMEAQITTCTICGYKGVFSPVFGHTAIRMRAECPQCGSRERHRMIKWCIDQNLELQALGDLLHFAPEKALGALVRQYCSRYITADLDEGRADLVLNMEVLDLEDNSLDTVMANHVLEHLDDAKALGKLFRVIRPGGRALLTFPVIYGMPETYEDPSINTPALRHRHYGQSDHVRYYGRDVDDRIAGAGFRLEKIVASGAAVADFAFSPGETLYIANVPEAA
ncbi:MAG: methyltransferase domain-containing protein [Pseudomonadota bacterium]